MKLNGTVALVTGASKGLGAGIAIEAAREGADAIINYNTDEEGARRTLSAVQQLGRAGTVEDVAKPVIFLASDEASYVTGQTFWADGVVAFGEDLGSAFNHAELTEDTAKIAFLSSILKLSITVTFPATSLAVITTVFTPSAWTLSFDTV